MKWRGDREALQCLLNLLPFGAEGSAGLPNLQNLPFSEFGSKSNANCESPKSTIFRIGTNQTHPKFHWSFFSFRFHLDSRLYVRGEGEEGANCCPKSQHFLKLNSK